MSTLQTQEFACTWLVQIFMKNKNFYNWFSNWCGKLCGKLCVKAMSELLHSPHWMVKPCQIALPANGVGVVNAVLPFEFISLLSSSLSSFVLFPSPRLLCLVLCVPYLAAPWLSASLYVCSPWSFVYSCLGCCLPCWFFVVLALLLYCLAGLLWNASVFSPTSMREIVSRSKLRVFCYPNL